jgi:L-lysine exporter family protein LysE/ArgO
MQGYSAFAIGMALGFGSVLSIGPNNLMLLREGLLRGLKWLVASTVFSIRTAMFAIACLATNWHAVLGPAIQTALTWLGLLALLWFCLVLAKSGPHGSGKRQGWPSKNSRKPSRLPAPRPGGGLAQPPDLYRIAPYSSCALRLLFEHAFSAPARFWSSMHDGDQLLRL